MNRHLATWLPLLIAAAPLLPSPALLRGEEMKLWYGQPAAKWAADALPVGNGRLGAMVFGGVDRERIQFNENSLWTGDENPSGDYKTMGEYQNFGDLLLSLDAQAGGPSVSCTSDHKSFFESEAVAFSVDGSSETKWCVEHKGRPVVWQAAVPADAAAVTSYSFTSANDTPKRDPRTWEMAGSPDGREWTVLDKRENQPIFERRGETKTFAFENKTPYRYYRLTFVPNDDMAHFQIAEIGLGGVSLGASRQPTAYRRELDLSTGIARTEFTIDGVKHCREVFASQPAQVVIVRWTADKPGAIAGVVALKGTHKEETAAHGAMLTFAGAFDNGLKYEAVAKVLAKGGKVEAVDNAVQLAGCDEATIMLAGGTSYVMDADKNFLGDPPRDRLQKQIDTAATKSFDALRDEHVKDHQALFNRCRLELGPGDNERAALPTDKRLAAYAKAGGDVGLEALLFAYGRYLLIGCSRPGGLPANLQGLWNDSNSPPWHSDYHTNINVQMNYWPAEPANLGVCHLPLFLLIKSQLPAWRTATAAAKEFALPSGKTRGWTVRTSHNITGGMGWKWDNTSNAWYAQHFWWHYEFGGDRKFLRDAAYPILKEVCEFWEDHLKTLPDGRLVVPMCWSPEHGPTEDGVSYSQEIVWDLFNNYVEAADALGVDRPYRDRIAAMRDKLVTPQIGRWGQLQEWMTDRDDPKDQHRHTSHLFALYPGRQISMAKTPELATAAGVSLAARGEAGDSRRSWTWPWRGALWARLGKPEDAHRMVRGLLTYNVLPNLFGNHPPFQMDGNFGITAAMCEMLLQSQAGELELLPALPKAWPNGRVTGLRGRGGFTVDITWQDGRLTEATIHAALARKCTVRYAGKTASFAMQPGEARRISAELK